MSYPFRVTERSANLLMVNDLESSAYHLQQLQQQAATGKVINRPSDNPSGTAISLDLRSQVMRYKQYSSNAADGLGWLGAADSSLSSVNRSLNEIQTLVINGATGGSQDAQSRAALATQIDAYNQTLQGEANGQYQDRPLFGGTSGGVPYPNASAQPPDYTYAGVSKAITRQVGPNDQAQVSTTADTVFGSGATSIFATLDKIASDLRSGDQASLSGADLTAVKDSLNQVIDVQGQVGNRFAALTSLQTQTDTKVQALQASLGGVEDADMARTLSDIQLATVAYQAALATTAKVIQPSLADFLK